MTLRPLHGYNNFPANEKPEDPHLGLNFDYEFAGKRMGEQLSLLVNSWIIDYRGNIFSRKASYLLPRIDALQAITKHIRKHLIDMGVDDMSCRRLMRDFKVDNRKCIAVENWAVTKINS